MININNLSFKYRNGNEVLKNINLNIEDGEFISIIGKNGTGKSTLGRLISGLVKPTSGSVTIDSLDTKDKKNALKIRQKVGVVFQNPENQLLFNNVYDELAFGLKNLNKEAIDERIEESLAMVGMRDFKNKEIYELSLGQKQRIALAEALSIGPKFILLDEPTTMLDSKGKEDVHLIVSSLRKNGYTIVYITNMADEILLSDRIILLDKGGIAKEIKRDEILNHLELLESYDVRIPTMVRLVSELRECGFNLDSTKFEVKDLVKQLKEMRS